MVKVKVISDKPNKRILRCSEGNMIWYQIWITKSDMICIERFFDGYGEVKRWWLPNLQMWYVFFMRKIEVRGEEFLGRIGLRF